MMVLMIFCYLWHWLPLWTIIANQDILYIGYCKGIEKYHMLNLINWHYPRWGLACLCCSNIVAVGLVAFLRMF